jgi:hypothetical protein
VSAGVKQKGKIVAKLLIEMDDNGRLYIRGSPTLFLIFPMKTELAHRFCLAQAQQKKKGTKR